MLKLNQLGKDSIGIIKKIECNDNIKIRLMDMGFHKNEEIRCILISPSKSIKAYLIKNTLISLRDNDAQNIWVEVKDENSFNR